MIHNEVVIINACGLGDNTKYKFDKKALLDMEQAQEQKEENTTEMVLKLDSLDDEYDMVVVNYNKK